MGHLTTIEEDFPPSIPVEVIHLIDNLRNCLETRFTNLEADILASEATFLDPRFKKKGFKYEHNYKRAMERIKNRVSALCNAEQSRQREVAPPPTVSTSSSIWADFDLEVASLVPENPTAAGIREVDRYIDEDYLHRSKNPLQ